MLTGNAIPVKITSGKESLCVSQYNVQNSKIVDTMYLHIKMSFKSVKHYSSYQTETRFITNV